MDRTPCVHLSILKAFPEQIQLYSGFKKKIITLRLGVLFSFTETNLQDDKMSMHTRLYRHYLNGMFLKWHSLLSCSRALFTDRVERRGFRSTLALCSSSRMSTFSLPSDWIGVKYEAGPLCMDLHDGSSPWDENNEAILRTFIRAALRFENQLAGLTAPSPTAITSDVYAFSRSTAWQTFPSHQCNHLVSHSSASMVAWPGTSFNSCDVMSGTKTGKITATVNIKNP